MKKNNNEQSSDIIIDCALDRSAHELQVLANFYHQHGYLERAQELYKTILRIRQDRNVQILREPASTEPDRREA